MKAFIKLEVPDYQIGQHVTVHFKDMVVENAICEAEKIRPKPEKLLPCICGSKRREHWYGTKDWNAYILICCKCKLTVEGGSEIEVHKKWNEKINELSANETTP